MPKLQPLFRIPAVALNAHLFCGKSDRYPALSRVLVEPYEEGVRVVGVSGTAIVRLTAQTSYRPERRWLVSAPACKEAAKHRTAWWADGYLDAIALVDDKGKRITEIPAHIEAEGPADSVRFPEYERALPRPTDYTLPRGATTYEPFGIDLELVEKATTFARELRRAKGRGHQTDKLGIDLQPTADVMGAIICPVHAWSLPAHVDAVDFIVMPMRRD